MGEIKENIKVDVVNLDLVKTLVTLLYRYKDDLPGDIISALEEIAENSEVTECGISYIKERGFGSGVIYADGVKVEKSLSINPILKRIKAFNQADMYPESATMFGVDDEGKEVELLSW